MTNIETRNRKIYHLIEATAVDFCKLYGAAYEIKERIISVYHSDESLWYISLLNLMTMMFHEAQHLLTVYSFELNYKYYSLLKSKLIIEVYTQLQNISEIKLALNERLKEMENIGAN